jgi:hypothetical protein
MKKIILVFFSFLFPVFLFFLLELGTHFAKAVYENFLRGEVIFPVDSIDYRAFPDPDYYILNQRRFLADKKVWDGTYRVLRGPEVRVPMDFDEDASKTSTLHVNLIGGSFTYGVNLNDDETLSGKFYQFLSVGSRLNVNNFGIPGGGPHNSLFLLDRYRNYFSSMTPGYSYYFFIDDHIPRSVIDIKHIGDLFDTPFYIKDQLGEISYAGPYSEVKPFYSQLLYILSKSLFLKKIGFNPPIGKIVNTFKEQAGRVCDLLLGVKDRVVSTFPKTKFKVVFLPKSGVSRFLLGDCLAKRGVDLLDLTKLLDSEEASRKSFFDDYYFPDNHPRGIFNEAVVKKIIELDSLK